MKKSARLAGIASDRVRALAVDADFRMRVDALARICVLSFRARREHMDACVEDVTAAVAAVIRGRR